MEESRKCDQANGRADPSQPDTPCRFFQVLLIASTFALSWVGMMVVHEFGHVLFAWASGGMVARVVLSPLEFSRTDLQKNPHPLFVAWGGALVGTVLPLGISLLWRAFRWPAWYVLQFFAGFCLVANGVYLGVVSFMANAADPADLMREGAPQWVLVLFGLVAFPSGLFLWNRLGTHFGLSEARGRVDRRVAIAVFFVLVAIVAAEILTYAG
ncbi:MAG TPA: hypothetical protein VEC99_04665 [Clostridia bacterium]|nr:hypothetical protein [Clostridia bacterium]